MQYSTIIIIYANKTAKIKTFPAPARFHRVASKNSNLRSSHFGGFFLRCQILPQPSEILPQLQEMVPQALEIIAQLSEILPQLQEMVPQLLEMVPQLIEIIPQVLEMVPQVQEMVKQHCGMISVIDNLFILLFICYIYN